MEGLRTPPGAHPLKGAQDVDWSLSGLRGVGPARLERFRRKGIHTVWDLLLHTPARYEDRTRFIPIGSLRPGLPALVRGRVVSAGEQGFRRRRGTHFRIVVRDGTGELGLVWFHYRAIHLMRFAAPGTPVTAYGRVQRVGGALQMAHADVRVASSLAACEPPGIRAVYPQVEGVPDATLRSAIRLALERHGREIRDPLPEFLRARLGFPGLAETLSRIHHPLEEAPPEALNRFETPAQRRLLFDRFLCVMLSLAWLRTSKGRRRKPPFRCSREDWKDAAFRFPFSFTPGQASAVEDVCRDLSGGRPMERLVMGDVGCGKTAVAAAAVRLCVQNGFQAALMAPTRILAEQHAAVFEELSERLDLHPVLITGSLKRDERRRRLEAVRRGSADLVIGTHSLVQEGVSFERLGLVVIDEQQRFGVRARARLASKGRPHLLVLTATPIPRTLAMSVYGDLDISVIRDRPEGRLPVVTRLVEEGGKRELAAFLAERMAVGEQVIVVCPAVEASEENGLKDVTTMARGLKRLYSPRFRVGTVHGRLSEEERLRVMDGFRRGTFDLLVATTVIEVGMHVPNATVMVVEHPERFGLAQLHQLRGRVGRGSVQGTCFLVRPPELSKQGLARLTILVEEDDGFRISEQDLRLRGQGELTGLRQAGAGELDLEEILGHPVLLEEARRAAEEILEHDPALERPEHGALRRMVTRQLNGPRP